MIGTMEEQAIALAFAAALTVGFTLVPLTVTIWLIYKHEKETGNAPWWGYAFLIVAPLIVGAIAYTNGAEYGFVAVCLSVATGVLVGSGFCVAVIKLAPKAYWIIRYFVWKATGLWGTSGRR